MSKRDDAITLVICYNHSQMIRRAGRRAGKPFEHEFRTSALSTDTDKSSRQHGVSGFSIVSQQHTDRLTGIAGSNRGAALLRVANGDHRDGVHRSGHGSRHGDGAAGYAAACGGELARRRPTHFVPHRVRIALL